MTRTAVAGDGDYDPEYVAAIRRDFREVREKLNAQMETLRKAGLLPCPDGAPTASANRTTPAMLVLRPGDEVLVTLAEDPDPDTATNTALALRKHFPGVDFLIATGITGIVVAPPD